MINQADKPNFLASSWKAIYVVLAVIYLLMMERLSFPYSAIVKALPIGYLLLTCFMTISRLNIKLCLALMFSAFGDVLLASPIELSFELGLGSFLIAHIFYIWIFIRKRGKLSQYKNQLFVLGLYCVSMAAFILPLTEQLFLPVAVYMLTITIMGISAVLFQGSSLVKLGAISFILSDSFIAIERFHGAFEGSGLVIMSTYYLAQLLITVGVIKENQQ
ncbi:lysoplasmalogenase [Alteromonadaceae bacterium M269]|nr:lysoplasmalogenase [Alteromonadaceae bacterium M269]